MLVAVVLIESGSVIVELDSVKLNIAFPPIAFFVILRVGCGSWISVSSKMHSTESPAVIQEAGIGISCCRLWEKLN